MVGVTRVPRMRNATEDRALLGRVWNKMPVFPAKTQETGGTKVKARFV